LPVYRAVRVDRRAALHLLLRQRRPEPRGTGDHLKGERRDQDLTARQPRPGIDDEIANGPGVIVEIQILNAADIAVHRLDRDTLEVASSPEHVALLPEVPRLVVSRASRRGPRRVTAPWFPLLLRLRRWTVVLQRELDRHAVALLHVLERRRRKMEQHPALGSLDEESPLVRRHARHFARHRVATQQGGVRRRLSSRGLRRRCRGTLRDREAREQQAGRRAGEHGWQLHDISLLFCSMSPCGSNARASDARRARNDRKRGGPDVAIRFGDAFLLGRYCYAMRSYRVNHSSQFAPRPPEQSAVHAPRPAFSSRSAPILRRLRIRHVTCGTSPHMALTAADVLIETLQDWGV